MHIAGAPRSMPQNHLQRREIVGLAIIFLWFFIGGIFHFIATDVEMSIVPPFIPYPRAAVLISGVAEWLGAFGVAWRPTRRAAGIGLLALTIAVTPANIYMLQQHAAFAVPLWALWLRLPVQVVLLLLIYRCTVAQRVR